MGETGLTQARRTVKKNVVQGFPSTTGRSDSYLQIILGLVLSGKISEIPGSKTGI